MQYSDFVKQKMAEMAGSNIKASEKMKKIGEEWRGMKAGFGKSRAQTSNAGFGKSRAQAREETDMDKMVKLLSGKKSKAAGTKIIKAVKKMKQPVENSVKSSEMSQLVQEMKQIEETPKEDDIGHHMGHHTINRHGLGF